MRQLHNTLYGERIRKYQTDHQLAEDEFSFSEQQLVEYFKGEANIKKYIIDSIKNSITHSIDNKLKEYIDFEGKAKELPISYSSFEKTFFNDIPKIQCMESWFLADPDTLRRFFGKGFNTHALPGNIDIKSITKTDVFRSLANASRGSEKGSYGKAAHSFEILEKIDVDKIISFSPSVQRLIHELDKVL